MSTEPEFNLNDYLDALENGVEYQYLPSGDFLGTYYIKSENLTTDGISFISPASKTIPTRKTEPGFPNRKEFIVIIKKDAEYANAFENDMEGLSVQDTPLSYVLSDGSNVLSQTPIRQVTYSGTKPTKKSRLYKYFLTEEEAETLKTDFRVEDVEVPHEQRGIFLELFDVQSGPFTRQINGQNEPFDMIQIVYANLNGSFIEGEEIYQVANQNGQSALYQNATAKGIINKKSLYGGGLNNEALGMLYLNKNSNLLFNNFIESKFTITSFDFYIFTEVQTIKGVTSGAEAHVVYVSYHLKNDGNWALPRSSSYGDENDPIDNKYFYSNDGTGVDVVIIDTGIDYNHPEFEDRNGNSRIKMINWWTAAGIEYTSSYPSWTIDKMYLDTRGHGTHVAATVAGKTFGWAKNSDIYVLKIFDGTGYIWSEFDVSTYNSVTAALYLLKEWHKRKPINPETGVKRPTIVNCSWGFSLFGAWTSWPFILTNDNKTIFLSETNPPTSIKNVNFRGTNYNNNNLPSIFNPFFQVPSEYIHDRINTSIPEILNGIYCHYGRIFSFTNFAFTSSYKINLQGGSVVGRFGQLLSGTINGIKVQEVDTLINECISEGIHFCIAAGNTSQKIANKNNQDYNNYATINRTFSLSINDYGFVYDQQSGEVYEDDSIGPFPSFDLNLYYNRKGSPYDENSIVVGSIHTLKRSQTTDSFNGSPFENGNVLGEETRSAFSMFGSGVDVWAGGENIISAYPNYDPFGTAWTSYSVIARRPYYGVNHYYLNNNYSQIKISGTSMATPQVCGVGALFLQENPELTPEQLKQKIIEFSIPNGLKDGFDTVTNESLNYPIRNPINGEKLIFATSDNFPNSANTIKFNTSAARSFFAYGVEDPAPILFSPFSTFSLPRENISITFGSNKITFTWNYPTKINHSHYDVYRSINENFGFEKINSSPITTEIFEDTNIITGTTYYYRIYSVLLSGELTEADTIEINFSNFNSLSKIIVYPVVYKKDTNGNILKDENGIKIIDKPFKQVNISDDYKIITEIKQTNE